VRFPTRILKYFECLKSVVMIPTIIFIKRFVKNNLDPYLIVLPKTKNQATLDST